MAGRTPEEAADGFLLRFKQTLACITDSHLTPSGYRPAPALHTVTLVPRGRRAGDPTPLRTPHGRLGLLLSVRHGYRITQGESGRPFYEVRAAQYGYVISDEQGNEILAYHWHPEDPLQPGRRSKVQAPHLHLSNTIRPISIGQGYEPVALADMHLRTGLVLIEDIVELLIEEFRVRALKPDWQTIVDENRERARGGE